jgi:hypothetical protein
MLDKWCIFMRLLQPSARGIVTYIGTVMADTVRLEGLAVYFGDDYFGLHLHRHGST